ncbi:MULTISPECIES: oxidoreductase [unclassified Novosphingobium]|uniref:oxidoreductase n=1 Tax=unclassified Novosphingobium TaxID=2644732 RepID=UPI001447C2FE|nr:MULTISPECIES: oxidoreductase [unclassified Novosphingobium]NKJ44245.1 NAD(P)-dependent dehydrogenase (short-subunit alcohol dehydrogenase family) [Novosphingobium sp. SG720]NMN05019.1 NAD(P)-dependent dehydrogenase (short-subunit alcohol dehydrogenase family) [Novosphingobium sp. SG919]NMN87313.1 NAD(P)-dependent dehydrogenase (short-subunit alcohol dehydrogenase family) [Novosphingobium sp. SG916]
MRTWFITGVSSGFGKAIAVAALAAGDTVAGSLRRIEDCAAFEALAPGQALGILLDVTQDDAIQPAVQRIQREIGPIDILVNNAGYGHEGLVEESSLDDLRRQFDVNVFGAVAVIKAVLPQMRERRRGHILNITSMGGMMTLPGLAYYHGSKFALEGISESLGKEVKHLGIHVTAVEPGSFRTDWAGRSMVRSPRSIADYDQLMDPIRQRREALSGHQAGDPALLAAAIIRLVAAQDPPAHLLLGSDALRLVSEKLADLQAEFSAWRSVTESTDFPVPSVS